MEDNNNFLSRIIPATRILQTLTKRGVIKNEYVEKAQKIIVDAKKDYDEYINDFFEQHLKEIKKSLDQIQSKKDMNHVLNDVSSSIANFRANMSMIDDRDFIDICSIVLKWSESVEKIDEDFFDILNSYCLSLEKIFVTKNISSKQVSFFILEIDNACQRYFNKHSEIKITQNMKNTKALYVSETQFGVDIDKIHLCEDENVENITISKKDE